MEALKRNETKLNRADWSDAVERKSIAADWPRRLGSAQIKKNALTGTTPCAPNRQRRRRKIKTR